MAYQRTIQGVYTMPNLIQLAAFTLLLSATSIAAPSDFKVTRSTQQVTLGDTTLSYQASFSEQLLPDAKTTEASISATGYQRVPLLTSRPVIFSVNGGPGASSSPLHFSGYGPYIRMGKGKEQALVANPDTLLASADLVFIDPPGTGMSRAPESDNYSRYWASEEDATLVRDFIQRWLTQHGRTKSPVYLVGESYGGYRVATLLAQQPAFNLAGVVLISPMLDASGSSFATGNELPYLLALPSMAVTAAKHQKSAEAQQPLEAVFENARAYAMGDYALALLQGTRLSTLEAEAVAQKLSALLGVSESWVLQHHLRITPEQFRQHLLADEGLVTGRLDSRITAEKPKPRADGISAANDPALGIGNRNVITSSLYTDYFKGMHFPTPKEYVALSLDVNFNWNYHTASTPLSNSLFYQNAAPYLAARLAEAPSLKLMVLTGYYDLAVPALAPWYALTHAGLREEQFDYHILPSGHSVFDDAAQRQQLTSLLSEFVQ